MALVGYGILLQFAMQAVPFGHVYLALLTRYPATQATFWGLMSEACITKKRNNYTFLRQFNEKPRYHKH